MSEAGARELHVMAKVVLFDAATMTAVWMNEAALGDLSDELRASAAGLAVADAVPLAETLGLSDGLRRAAESGQPQHLRASLVSTVRGSVAIVCSVYPLPDGRLLSIVENAWQPSHREGGRPGERGSDRRSR